MPRSHRPAVIEFCESRTLLSATVASVLHPDYVRRSPAVTNDTVQGYTPAQIRAAYGFTGLTFANGTIAADGAGQTIAIVDAYNDPNIAADLKVFDTAFDLPAPPSFKIVSQTGGAHLPKTDSGWAGEIALDVEWAHAIAPAANILLVEADSDSTTDLLAAVNYARNAAGVSAVSMSWGGSEFVSSYNGGESNQQTTYDATFTTPLRHASVTFVAAAGDTGQPTGAQWPATAPDVLSVGGTSLHLADDGTYQSETGWAGTSAGYSAVETEPAYQQVAQQSGLRSVSDVAYVGDPNTGVAVYDSLPADGSSGWATVGGTSAGAPQWAALVAIANQGRVVAGLTPLNGSSQTLPVLYSLYGTTGTAAHAGYVAAFNDVTSGGTGRGGGRRGGGGGSTSAVAGYDIVTGLGTPKAAAVVAALATGKSGTGVSDAPAPSATSLPIGLTLLSTPAAAVVGGAAGSLRYRLTNPTAIPFGGPVTIVLRASADATVDDADTVVTTRTIPYVRLNGGAAKTVVVRFTYPDAVATGDYQLIAVATATGTERPPTTVASPAVAIAAPTVDLSVAFDADTVMVDPGRRGKVRVVLTNLGNVTAVGTVVVDLYSSTTGTVDATAVKLTTSTKRLHVGTGKSVAVTLPLSFPTDLSPGSDGLVVAIAPTTTPTDADPSDNAAAAPTS